MQRIHILFIAFLIVCAFHSVLKLISQKLMILCIIICRIQNLSSNHNQTTWQLNSPLQHQISCHHRAVLGSGSACFLLWPGPVAQHRAASQHCLCVVLCNNLPKETGAPASSPSPGPGLCNLDVVYRNLYAMYLSIRYRIHFECAIMSSRYTNI